jgi:hypothetical protein
MADINNNSQSAVTTLASTSSVVYSRKCYGDKKVYLEIFAHLHLFNTPIIKKVVSGTPFICMYVCM